MEFINFIKENFGLAFALSVLIVSAIISGIIWLTIWCVKVVLKNKELEKKIDGLPCPDHKKSISRHSEQFENLLSSLSRLNGQMDMLVKAAFFQPAIPSVNDTEMFSEKESPRKLNSNGENIYTKVNGNDFLNVNGTFLLSEIEKLHPKTALDVERFALSTLFANSDKDFFNRLKDWVYNAPTIDVVNKNGETVKREILFEDILYILSIPLRDRYLSKHPEILTD